MSLGSAPTDAVLTSAVDLPAPPPADERSAQRFKDLIRRVIWNSYAWPLTVVCAIGFIAAIGERDTLGIVEAVASLPWIAALHLHIWDRRTLSALAWRLYAVCFVVGELVLNFGFSSEAGFKPTGFGLAGLAALLLPSYIALFRYAFRDWRPRPA
jgi:hypothetical protein